MTIRRNILASLFCLAAAGCGANSAIQRGEEFLTEGYVLQAFEELDQERTRQLQEDGAVDDELQAEWLRVRFRYLLERGRQEIYLDREVQGIATLQEALELRPGDEQLLALFDRARLKLAKREVAIGGDMLAKKDFEQAVAAFRRAQGFKPDFAPAVEGEAKVRESVSRLHGEAQKQFLDAVRKLPEFRYPEVDWHAQAAISRDPSRADAAEVKRRAMNEIAQDARERAEESRTKKLYGAALMEYRTAQRIWADMPGVATAIAEMERELQAQQKMEQAQLAVQSGRFDQAAALLEEAQTLSVLERATVTELRVECRKRQGMLAYKAARDLELQGLKQEALGAFLQLVVDWPEGLDDEKTRIEALHIDIDAAVAAYAAGAEAEQRGDHAVALEQFKTARTYYAKYRDVAARIAAIEAKLAQPASEGAGGGS